MKKFLICCAALIVLSNCAKPGDFCFSYTDVVLNEETSSLLLEKDRDAAVAIAANRLLYERCP